MSRWRVLIHLALAVLVTTATSQAVADPFLQKLLNISGLTAAPGQMRSEEVAPGKIMVVDLDGGSPKPLTADGNYRSPLFTPDGKSVMALQGDQLVQLPLTGGIPKRLQRIAGALKLVGFTRTNPEEIVILVDHQRSPLASLSISDGKIALLPYDKNSANHQRMLSQIRNQDRTYGGLRVTTKNERKQGLLSAIEWTDIYVQLDQSPAVNVSRCDGANCSQPSLSPSGKQLAFIKTED